MSDQNNNISLLADIGGTFCRFSIIRGDIPDLKDYKKIKCDDFDFLEGAIDWYLQEIKQQDIENIFFAILLPGVFYPKALTGELEITQEAGTFL